MQQPPGDTSKGTTGIQGRSVKLAAERHFNMNRSALEFTGGSPLTVDTNSDVRAWDVLMFEISTIASSFRMHPSGAKRSRKFD